MEWADMTGHTDPNQPPSEAGLHIHSSANKQCLWQCASCPAPDTPTQGQTPVGKTAPGGPSKCRAVVSMPPVTPGPTKTSPLATSMSIYSAQPEQHNE